MGWAYFQMGWAYFQIGWAYFWMGWAYFQGRRFLKIRPPPSLSSHISSSPMGIFSRLRYYQATLIKAKHFMHFRSWQTRPESEKEFWDGLLHFTCRKLKKQREMPLPMHSPIPFLNFSCYRWDGICAWVMAFPLAPCFFTFLEVEVWLQRSANNLSSLFLQVQWRIQDFEKGGSYYLVRKERQKILLDHAHF